MQTASLKNSGALSLVINIEMIPFFFKFIPVSTQIDLDLGWLLFLLFPTSWPEYKMKKKLKEVTQKRKRWTRLEGQTANQRRRRRSGDRWRLFFCVFLFSFAVIFRFDCLLSRFFLSALTPNSNNNNNNSNNDNHLTYSTLGCPMCFFFFLTIFFLFV